MGLFLYEGVGGRGGGCIGRLRGGLLFAHLQTHLVGNHLLDLLRLLFDLPNILAALLRDVAHVIGFVIGALGLDGLSPSRLTSELSARLHGLDGALGRLIDVDTARSLWNTGSVLEILLIIVGGRIEIYDLFVKNDNIICSFQLLIYLSNLGAIRRSLQLILHFFEARNFDNLPSWHLILRIDDLRLDLTGRIPTD